MDENSAKRSLARWKKNSDTSVNQYSVGRGGSDRSTAPVVPPVPAPISRIRSGASGTCALTRAATADAAMPLTYRETENSPYNHSAISGDPSGNSVSRAVWRPVKTSASMFPQRSMYSINRGWSEKASRALSNCGFTDKRSNGRGFMKLAPSIFNIPLSANRASQRCSRCLYVG